MTEKLFFAGLVTVALAATSLVNVGAAKADGISVSGVTTAVGASGAPNVGAGQSTVSAGGGGSLVFSGSLTETAPSTANAATGASGFTANGLNGFGQSNAAISINPTTAGANAIANNNGNGATATGTYFNATQLGQYGNSGAQGGFVTIGKQ